MDRNKFLVEPHHLGVPSGASKIIYEPMLRLTQTMHLSCTNSNTISKRTKMRFHRIHIIKEFYRVHPKRLSSLWYFRRKPCTYIASRLALALNGPKRASSWASSPRRTIGCLQNDFSAYGTFGPNRAPILHPNRLKWDSTWASSPRSTLGCVQNDF
jgi:hypothetical protein